MKTLVCWLIAIPSVALACEDEHPEPATEPVVQRELRDSAGKILVKMEFDPRGLRDLRTSDELHRSWIRDDGDAAWDYREWQWWKGHPWGDSCRPRYWTEADFSAEPRQIVIKYTSDGFDSQQQFLLPESVPDSQPYWDVLLRVRNNSGADVEEYGQFFACYTAFNEPNSFWFWEKEDSLRKFADLGVVHLNGFVVHPEAYFLSLSAIPHCPRGDGKIVSTWYRPVMVSHPSAAGWRSIVMIEPEHTASLAQGIRGSAMDYIVFPGPEKATFANQAEFSVHVRHVLLKSPELPTIELLEELWGEFEKSHTAIRQLVEQHP